MYRRTSNKGGITLVNFFHLAKFSFVFQNQNKPPTLVHIFILLHDTTLKIGKI